MGVMVFLVAFGLGSVILGNPLILTALKWVGIAFLLWLSWKVATAGRGGERAEAEVIGFWEAAAFQWVNPKSWLVSASAVAATPTVMAMHWRSRPRSACCSSSPRSRAA
jgi:threonine/homoserine/homoserine lactone efflux protein